jgi:ribosome biogenesis GTPase
VTGIDETLAALGWTEDRRAAFAEHAAQGLVPARVSLEHNYIFRVMTAEGERLAEASGRLKHRATGRHELPIVGDWVALRTDVAGERDQISDVLPRRSALSRKSAGRETEEQVLAANIDIIGIVFGLDLPVNPRSIERYLVVVGRSGAAPVVVLNKADLSDDIAGSVAEAAAAAGAVPVIAVSTRGAPGLDRLDHLSERGRTLALVGPSGAGKSSIVNQLVSGAGLPTGEVREWDGRGRHTSVHRQLVVRPTGGLIIDTPGMRELQLWDHDPIADAFLDVAALSSQCRFRDCRHEREPGCAVKQAVEAGSLDSERYANYLKLQAEQTVLDRKVDELAQAGAKRTLKIRHKALRSFQKDRGR